MLPATKSNQTAQEDEQWPFFYSLSSSLPHISRVQRCVQAPNTEGPSGTFTITPRLHQVGEKTEGKPRRGIFNRLRRGGKMPLGKPVAVEGDRTGHHVTARGPDTLSQDRKGSFTKVNKRIQEWRHVLLSWGESGIQAQQPHIYKNYHQNEEATWT